MKNLYALFIFTLVSLACFAQGTVHTVLTGNFYFNPAAISNVEVGDVIRWEWVEGSHTTTSASIPAGAASWDAPLNSSNTFYEYTVTVPGQYNYVCTPHAGVQTGSFTVVSANTLSVSPSNRDVMHTAGNTTFDVSSNTSWSAVSNAAWCTVTPSGNGNGTITATYTQNTNTTARIASITVAASGVTPVVVTVTQDGAPATLSVSPSNHDVSHESGSASFTVMSNSSWTAMSNADWCNVTAGGTGNGTLMASYDENTGTMPRIAEISVNVTGLNPETVTVTQAGAPLILSVTPANRDVTFSDGSTTFDVESNADWTAISDAAWCVVTPGGSGNGTITATYEENSGSAQRVANISVEVDGLDPLFVTVSQEGISVGIGETGTKERLLHVFPNPAGNTLNVQYRGMPETMAELSVTDLHGKVFLNRKAILSGKSPKILDISGLPGGIYLVKLRSAQHSVTQMFIKK